MLHSTRNQVPTLRITHSASQVEATLEGDGPRKTERRAFTFTLSPQEAEDFRWYLEDYRIYPVETSPKFAQRIEQRMGEVGRELFRLVLAGSDVWRVCAETSTTRASKSKPGWRTRWSRGS